MTMLLLNPKISSGKPRIATSKKYPDIPYEDAKSPSHLNTIDNNPTLTIKNLLDNSTSVAEVTEEVSSEGTTVEPKEPKGVIDVSDKMDQDIENELTYQGINLNKEMLIQIVVVLIEVELT